MSTVEQIMKYPKSLADKYYLSAFIAGGYLRDTLLGKKVKDIDVFMIPEPSLHFDFDDAERIAEDEEMEITSLSSELSEDTLNDHICLTTAKVCDNVENYYNFIFLDKHVSPEAILNTFDFGICQIGITEDMEVITFPEFWKDVLNKTVTLLRYRSEERKEYRVGKMKEKFFNYKLVEEV